MDRYALNVMRTDFCFRPRSSVIHISFLRDGSGLGQVEVSALWSSDDTGILKGPHRKVQYVERELQLGSIFVKLILVRLATALL